MSYPTSQYALGPTPTYTLFPADTRPPYPSSGEKFTPTGCLDGRQLNLLPIQQSEIKPVTQNTEFLPQIPQKSQTAIMTRKATHSANSQPDNKLPSQASLPPDFSLPYMSTTVDGEVLSVDPAIPPPSQEDEKTLINKLNLREVLGNELKKVGKSLPHCITWQLKNERAPKKTSYFFGKVSYFSPDTQKGLILASVRPDCPDSKFLYRVNFKYADVENNKIYKTHGRIKMADLKSGCVLKFQLDAKEPENPQRRVLRAVNICSVYVPPL